MASWFSSAVSLMLSSSDGTSAPVGSISSSSAMRDSRVAICARIAGRLAAW